MGNACCCCCFGGEETGTNENGSDHHRRALMGGGSPVPSSDKEAVRHESEGTRHVQSATSPADAPLSINQNPRGSQMSADDSVRGQDRGSSHSCGEESVQLTESVQQQPEISKVETTQFDACKPEKCIEQGSDFSLKVHSSVELNGVQYPFPSSEDEDVCPTCLEEYTEEHPRIVTHCFHHYHLSCIYAWLERSETCPMCGALMEFDE